MGYLSGELAAFGFLCYYDIASILCLRVARCLGFECSSVGVGWSSVGFGFLGIALLREFSVGLV